MNFTLHSLTQNYSHDEMKIIDGFTQKPDLDFAREMDKLKIDVRMKEQDTPCEYREFARRGTENAHLRYASEQLYTEYLDRGEMSAIIQQVAPAKAIGDYIESQLKDESTGFVAPAIDRVYELLSKGDIIVSRDAFDNFIARIRQIDWNRVSGAISHISKRCNKYSAANK
jgi:hypothetical protein